MRRRPPHIIHLSRSERRSLRNLLVDGRTEQRVARRARILLAMANPATILTDLAERFEPSRSGIWTLCRHFEQRGVDVIYDAARSGRPRTFSPSGACRTGGVGLL
jgi:transposase